jgi:uncharacterized protein (TIGR00299 family) protein
VRIGYFNCFAGASGDMIIGCLFDLGFTESGLREALSGIDMGDLVIETGDVVRCGIRARAFEVRAGAGQPERTHKDILELIERSDLSPAVKGRSIQAFDILADAESRIHGMPKEDVHFHEVGAVDSIVDVVGAFAGLESLGIDKVVSSPLALGTGSVECRHGTLPVPAPATLEIARGLPVRGWHLPGEATTPTGAAILKTCASGFGPIPDMDVTGVGYGAGSRDPAEFPNVLRLIVGEKSAYGSDRVVVAETNIDDMNPQFFSHLYSDLLARRALDVWVTQVLMKKGRPGFVLSVLARHEDVSQIADAMLRETTTSGVRFTEAERIKLPRVAIEVETRYGKVKVKVFDLGTKRRCAPEYDDCLRVSLAANVSIDEVIEEARNACRRKLEDFS